MIEEVFLTGASIREADVRGRTVVVLDALRSAATIAAALKHGARYVVPVADLAAGGKIAANLDSSTYVLGGERNGIVVDGYHLTNSPLAYTSEAVAGKTVILHSHNATPTITRCRTATRVLIGGFFNAHILASAIRHLGENIVIVCAGSANRVALEDTLCAGLLLHQLWGGQLPEHVPDAAHIACNLYTADKDVLLDVLFQCNTARRLAEQGREDDAAFCFRLNALPPPHLSGRPNRIDGAW